VHLLFIYTIILSSILVVGMINSWRRGKFCEGVSFLVVKWAAAKAFGAVLEMKYLFW